MYIMAASWLLGEGIACGYCCCMTLAIMPVCWARQLVKGLK